jgi:hypothetical protein
MDAGIVLSNIGVLITLALGLMAIFFPEKIQTFVSIRAFGKEGVSEVRATYGGFFVGIAIYAFFIQSKEVFLTIGLGWLLASLVRSVTLVFGAFTLKNVGAVVFEAVIGTLCVWSVIITK